MLPLNTFVNSKFSIYKYTLLSLAKNIVYFRWRKKNLVIVMEGGGDKMHP